MINEFLILMKQELAVIALIFILLFIKLGKDRSNVAVLNLVNVLLLLNLIAGFFGNKAQAYCSTRCSAPMN
jgi:NADH-quinone oxidoreductase subunit N